MSYRRSGNSGIQYVLGCVAQTEIACHRRPRLAAVLLAVDRLDRVRISWHKNYSLIAALKGLGIILCSLRRIGTTRSVVSVASVIYAAAVSVVKLAT